MKFELGELVMTKSINNRIANGDRQFAKFVLDSLEKYRNCEWGELTEDDKKANDNSVANGGDMILGAYVYDKNDTGFLGEGKIYIITEWDRSVTTILYPHEY